MIGSVCAVTNRVPFCAAIHLEFAAEPGKRVLRGSELRGTADICVRLANTGSYNTDHTLEEVVVVNVTSIEADGMSMRRLLDTATRSNSAMGK